jgi:hypothetical protein
MELGGIEEHRMFVEEEIGMFGLRTIGFEYKIK